MNKVFIVAILLLSMTAYTQQGAKAVITALADKCMNGNNVPSAVQGIVHGAINTAFGLMGRRRLLAKRNLGTMSIACGAVYNAATTAAGLPTVAANCFKADFNNKCVSAVSGVCTNRLICN